MGVSGHWLYLDEEDYHRIHSWCETWIYFKSLSLILNNQLILGLGIQPKLLGTNIDLEAGEGEVGARDLKQNPELSSALSSVDIEAMHTKPGFGNLSLGCNIYAIITLVSIVLLRRHFFVSCINFKWIVFWDISDCNLFDVLIWEL